MEEQPVDEAGGVEQAAVEQPGPLSLDGVVPSVNNGEVEEHKTDAIPEQNGELLPGEENGEEAKEEGEGGGGDGTEVVGENGEAFVKAEGEEEVEEGKMDFAGPGHFKERKKRQKRVVKKRVKVVEETSWECNECTYINNPLVSGSTIFCQ